MLAGVNLKPCQLAVIKAWTMRLLLHDMLSRIWQSFRAQGCSTSDSGTANTNGWQKPRQQGILRRPSHAWMLAFSINMSQQTDLYLLHKMETIWTDQVGWSSAYARRRVCLSRHDLRTQVRSLFREHPGEHPSVSLSAHSHSLEPREDWRSQRRCELWCFWLGAWTCPWHCPSSSEAALTRPSICQQQSPDNWISSSHFIYEANTA